MYYFFKAETREGVEREKGSENPADGARTEKENGRREEGERTKGTGKSFFLFGEKSSSFYKKLIVNCTQ